MSESFKYKPEYRVFGKASDSGKGFQLVHGGWRRQGQRLFIIRRDYLILFDSISESGNDVVRRCVDDDVAYPRSRCFTIGIGVVVDSGMNLLCQAEC